MVRTGWLPHEDPDCVRPPRAIVVRRGVSRPLDEPRAGRPVQQYDSHDQLACARTPRGRARPARVPGRGPPPNTRDSRVRRSQRPALTTGVSQRARAAAVENVAAAKTCCIRLDTPRTGRPSSPDDCVPAMHSASQLTAVQAPGACGRLAAGVRAEHQGRCGQPEEQLRDVQGQHGPGTGLEPGDGPRSTAAAHGLREGSSRQDQRVACSGASG